MQLTLPIEEKEIDGIGMGVFQDGSTFLSARGLARLCGIAVSNLLSWD